MSKDISKILHDWPYIPDSVSVRVVDGEDGAEKIQMRLDLGLLQMQLDGRPDGLTPEGCESWLDYYEQRQQAFDNGDADAFELTPEDCGLLLQEGIQYYHRYLSFWRLDRFELCARDTARNLRLFAFVRTHASRQRDKLQFDQWRPYVTMMNAKAVSKHLLEQGRRPAALEAIGLGIQGIERFLEDYNQTHRASECEELQALKRWLEEFQSESAPEDAPRPASRLEVLEQRLASAIAHEEFEQAAQLRDEIRRLRG